METQSRVIATLNKLKKAHAQKQQNLGAIEDAIQSEKDNLKNLIDSMVAVTTKLEAGIQVFAEETAQATSNLSDVMRESEGEFYNLQNQAFAIQNELDSLGLSDNSLNEVIDYFDEIWNEADSKL